ncbi:hypothetical protein [Longitalea arenae]|uniref:hypothetical protein n=1 Tax=Longitalea arenae TaxID=2812558 RepID=UPI0019677F2D|nr:hypothetical protein [Longitalea arenae]
MIQTTKRLVACALFICLSGIVHAQDQAAAAAPDQPLPPSDSVIAAQNAIRFADSLVKADFYTDWNTYLNLSMASAIKYYGGKEGYKESAVIAHYRNEPKTEEKPQTLRLVSMMNDIETWQCVIEKSRDWWDESRGKVKTTTYLVGESTDNGQTWKFIDVSHNSLQNIVYIMPSIFGTLEIPESKTIYVDEVAALEAAQAAQQAAKPTVKKKPVAKKPAK